ncbi:hypothetical protein [Rhodopila globiformis]|jgi:hypothetical protein|uniref:Uncharacterized protein n=1 Tax=Rhodopila globiformis TaxID=1071 RepID=A0A2S6MXP9_RHOGL|nr:hypothetical protein [Rhodopila globiformis]PPQ27143.1 hypothetical protein CCS01_28095 [Rhodopila globiformis]
MNVSGISSASSYAPSAATQSSASSQAAQSATRMDRDGDYDNNAPDSKAAASSTKTTSLLDIKA